MDRSFYESEIDALQKRVIAAQATAISLGDALMRAHDELRKVKAELTAEVAKNSYSYCVRFGGPGGGGGGGGGRQGQ